MSDTHMTGPRIEQGRIIPRIYVASLADYNANRLVGRWIEANQPPERLQRAIDEMLAESKEEVAEDWAIHDYEGFGRWRPSEFEDLETISRVAVAIGTHGELFSEVLHHCDDEIDRAIQLLQECHSGPYNSPADYASELFEDCYSKELEALPSVVRWAIDWEVVASELELSGDVLIIRHKHAFHVFDGHA
ncbi:MAG: antirestriction protein ArdA [Planctomycetota bacterium]|nr:antirestriction protein ArdA [Planctomycetota bacterium]